MNTAAAATLRVNQGGRILLPMMTEKQVAGPGELAEMAGVSSHPAFFPRGVR